MQKIELKKWTFTEFPTFAVDVWQEKYGMNR